MIPTIDLFAGAGGLGLGAISAGSDLRLSVDFDPSSCGTLRENASRGCEVLQADVSSLSGSDLRRLARVSPSDPLVIIGGAPCQPFSKAAYWLEDGDEARYRRARSRGERKLRPVQGPRPVDSRRDLLWQYMRLVGEAQADGFVFENVASILHPRNRHYVDGLVIEASRLGFHCAVVRTNAVEYGVPQRRQRVFVLASRGRRPIGPPPTHADFRHQSSPDRLPTITAGEALRLVSPRATFEPEEVVKGRYALHLAEVPPGQNYRFHSEWAGHPSPSFVAETRFWNFLLKLSPDQPSWTIAASPGTWVGPFHWESRRLRVPELAALQSFPHEHRFVGTHREVVRQIGNAVPPLLARPMVQAVLDSLSSHVIAAA